MFVESQNASFLILASDYPEDHTKKGKGAGITKIEGSGRKEGGEGTEKTMVAALVFIFGYLFGVTVLFEKKKNWRNDHEDFLVFQKSS